MSAARQDDARLFLEQQQALANGDPVLTKFGEMGHESVIYDPVIVTRPFKDGPVNSESPLGAEPNIRIGAHTRIDGFTKIEGGQGVRIGDYVHIASFAHLNVGGGTLIIEDGAAVASGVIIITGGNAPDAISCSAVAPQDQQVLHRRTVRIAKNACVYAGCVICPGVTIGEGARVAAGSVVTKDVPPFEIWRGNPARFGRMRNDEQAVSRR